MDAAASFLASLEESKITSLQDAAKKPPIEILPQGMASLYGPNPGQAQKKPGLALPSSQQQPAKPLLLEGSTTATPQTVPTSSEPTAQPSAESGAPQNSPPESATTVSESSTPSDPSVVLATESGDQGPQSNDTSIDNQDQVSTPSVSEPTTAEASVPPPSISITTAPDAGNNQRTGVRPELSMIDFT